MSLAFLVDDLAPSQPSFLLIRACNEYAAEGGDVVVFRRCQGPVCSSPIFPLLNEYDLPGFQGPVIATSYASALGLVHHAGPHVKGLYLQDLEWFRKSGDYEQWRGVYGHPLLRLFARSPDHAAIVSKAWQKTCPVLPDFSIPVLLGLLK